MTPGARRVLERLAADDDCDIAAERGVVYCGNQRTTQKVVHELLWLMAISVPYGNPDDSYCVYTINETGRSLLRRPELEAELKAAIAKGAPFTLANDQIVRQRR